MIITSIAPTFPDDLDPNTAGPLKLDTVRERIMMYSGITSEQLGLMMGAGAEKLRDQLSAQKTQYFSHEGVVTDERTTPDHPIQQKAAVELIGLAERIGGLRAKDTEGSGPRSNITFDLSGWTIKPLDKAPRITLSNDLPTIEVIEE